MKTEQQYHIDVTPEEDELFRTEPIKKKIADKHKTHFNTIFGMVLIGHLIGAAVVFGFAPTLNIKAKSPKGLQINNSESSSTTKNETAANNLSSTKPLLPNNINVNKPPHSVSTNPSTSTIFNGSFTKKPKIQNDDANKVKSVVTSNLIKEYTVKPGDTIYKLSKRYKLVSQRLIDLNQIKNPNQLKVGQKLKFF